MSNVEAQPEAARKRRPIYREVVYIVAVYLVYSTVRNHFGSAGGAPGHANGIAYGHALDVIGRAFPGVIEDCGDALSGALMNAGPIIHPPLITMNAAPLEHFERWDIHREGTQPGVRRVTDALDAERIAVREALGYGAPHFPLRDHYAREGEEWMYGRGSHDKLTDSGDWREHIVLTQHRYMLEDVRIGLSFLTSVGAFAGVPTPLARAFLAIGSAVCGEDFSATGRTLQSLGLGDMDRVALGRILKDGLP